MRQRDALLQPGRAAAVLEEGDTFPRNLVGRCGNCVLRRNRGDLIGAEQLAVDILQQLTEIVLELRVGDHHPCPGMLDQRMHALHVEGRVELLGQEGKDGWDGAQVECSPEG